jgi:putative tryptophan/tyrosine transport system substrate-binding protein
MEAGALISYGVNLESLFRDLATFVDQVAKGAKVGDIPIRGPSRYHITFNIKTANALGLTVPPMLLARADEVMHELWEVVRRALQLMGLSL